MVDRSYRIGDREFSVTLRATCVGAFTSWTVEGVSDARTGALVPIPGLLTIITVDEDTAFARACDRITAWMTRTA